MPKIRHHNIRNGDNEVYCCLRNRVVKLDEQQLGHFCQSCRMFAGKLAEGGVACAWDDADGVRDPHVAANPWEEFMRNQVKQVPPGESAASMQQCG
jgi:hypothetical protein